MSPATNLPTTHDLTTLLALSGGTSDATGLLEHIFNQVTPGSVLELPAGEFRVTRSLNPPPVDFTLRGKGVMSTALILDGPVSDASFITWRADSGAASRPGIQISDISFLARSIQGNAYAALDLGYKDEKYFTPSVKISRVRISPDFRLPNTGRFGNGVFLMNARQAILSDVWAFGRTEGQPSPETRSQAGLIFFGECTDSRVESSVFFQWSTGLIVQGRSEGIQLRENTFIFSEIGVAFNTPGEPQLQAIGNNFNTSVAGILMLSPLGGMITNNTFYANDPEQSSNQPYVGIDIRQGEDEGGDVESRNNHLAHNSFFLGGTKVPNPQYGIVLSSKVKASVVLGNTMEHFNGQFITLGPETHHNLVSNNVGEHAQGAPVSTAGVSDLGVDNQVFGNVEL